MHQIPLLLNALLLVETVTDHAALNYRQAVVPMADESEWRVNSVGVILHRALLQGQTTTIALG